MENLFCGGWLWPLLLLLGAYLLGYLTRFFIEGKYKRRASELESENNSLRAKLSAGGAIATGAVASANTDLQARISGLEADLSGAQSAEADLRARISGLEADLSGAQSTEADLRARIAGLEADLAACNEKQAGFLAAAAMPVSTKDDLKKIEGIGPKIESILNDAGIQTFAKLT
jgi:predicted flap endonuclease-1-like 5' DNA nuclease